MHKGQTNAGSFKKGNKCALGHIVSEEIRKKIRDGNRKNSSKGKKLVNQIVVHHINGNHFDDIPENRQAMTRSKHTAEHNKRGDVGFPKGNIPWNKKKKNN